MKFVSECVVCCATEKGKHLNVNAFTAFVLMFSKCKQFRYHHKAFCHSFAVALLSAFQTKSLEHFSGIFRLIYWCAVLTLFRLLCTLKSLANVIMSRCAMICDKFNFYDELCLRCSHPWTILIPIFTTSDPSLCLLSSHFISFIIYSKIMIANRNHIE